VAVVVIVVEFAENAAVAVTAVAVAGGGPVGSLVGRV